MRKLTTLIGLLALGLATAGRAEDKADHLAVIVGKGNPLESATFAELQKYFRAEKTKGSDGNKIAIVMLAAGQPERGAALREIYKMTEGEYNKYFLQATFTGTVAAAPKALPSAAAVKKFVAETPGAIGYLPGSEVDDSVKVVKVDGHLPGEPEYKLNLTAH